MHFGAYSDRWRYLAELRWDALWMQFTRPLEPEAKEPRPELPLGPDMPSEPGPEPDLCWQSVKVKLADGKARTIEHMMCTTF
jgi:hypothetical protein